ncbi:hypothetical protein E1B28_010569 [Marasmius oreades]|uniref:Decapping nuclease n=1 Tax=Marasmius oreades TaxID=181124 RepID=A0A9P7RY24_9AGAR|nr:uncharacterized protein E1B28_010569 [Marasmius oreades]KAG7091540.1 hypothetical protein E1B28_010569 [Marasmius oreades]
MILGPCQLIAHITTKHDGSYEINDHSATRIFPSTNENRCLNLGPTVRKILGRSPFTFFEHPKHLDSIISGCVLSGNQHVLKEANTVVTWRGILTRIFLGNKVIVHISFIDNTMYIEEADLKPEWTATQYALTDAVGMAFEDVYSQPLDSSLSAPNSVQPDPEHVDQQWGNLVQRSLGDLNLIFCGEVDAVKDDIGGGTPNDWFDKRVELKSRNIHSRYPISYARWHMQSSLLEVPEIFVGYRDNNLCVTYTDTVRVSDIQPANFNDSLQRGYNVLSALRATFESKREEEGTDLDDTIWKVVINEGYVSNAIKLEDIEAHKVKRRRELPHTPSVARVGIVPKEMVSRLRGYRR